MMTKYLVLRFNHYDRISNIFIRIHLTSLGKYRFRIEIEIEIKICTIVIDLILTSKKRKNDCGASLN